LLARYGGEEFVVLARGLDLKQGTQLAERLRVVAGREPVVVEGVSVVRKISAGIATLECCGADPSAQKILGIADERLYRAKATGRDRVVGAP
ncbi:MAG TPA: diguanylate cyclase, partial [Polyangiaceae bacterium]